MTAVAEHHISSVGGGMAASATSIRMHERVRARGGGGATEDRLADEEARHKVEEGTPARAVSI